VRSAVTQNGANLSAKAAPRVASSNPFSVPEWASDTAAAGDDGAVDARRVWLPVIRALRVIDADCIRRRPLTQVDERRCL
jgi:hypothetical protein